MSACAHLDSVACENCAPKVSYGYVTPEVGGLQVAVGQQTEMVRRWRNRATTLRKRLKQSRARAERAEAQRDAYRATAEFIERRFDCEAYTDEEPDMCFEAWPHLPDLWCVRCIASVSLAADLLATNGDT